MDTHRHTKGHMDTDRHTDTHAHKHRRKGLYFGLRFKSRVYHDRKFIVTEA